MIKAVIFDHDGVIADMEPLHTEADNMVLARYGFSISAEANESLVGVSAIKSWEIMREMFKIPKAAEWLASEKTNEVLRLIRRGIKPNEGLLGLLEALKGKNYKLAIASGQYRSVIDAVLSTLKIGSYFSTIVSYEDMTKGKPDPEVFLVAAQRLGVAPEECGVIEDSSPGVKAAKAAGMACIALRTSSTTSHDVSMADKIVSSLSEINADDLDLIKQKQ